MTLLELLRQKLPKRGGWPEGAVYVVQSLIDGELYFYDRRYDGNGAMWNLRRKYKFCKASDIGMDDATGLLTPTITREQYEATGWDGPGLPPVGVECEMQDAVGEFIPVDIIANHDGFAFGWNYDRHAVYFSDKRCEFRPLRTEAERAIDEMVQLSGVSIGAAKILYDAGYRKG